MKLQISRRIVTANLAILLSVYVLPGNKKWTVFSSGHFRNSLDIL